MSNAVSCTFPIMHSVRQGFAAIRLFWYMQVDQGGWDVLDMLLQGSSSCQDLTEAPFLNTAT